MTKKQAIKRTQAKLIETARLVDEGEWLDADRQVTRSCALCEYSPRGFSRYPCCHCLVGPMSCDRFIVSMWKFINAKDKERAIALLLDAHSWLGAQL